MQSLQKSQAAFLKQICYFQASSLGISINEVWHTNVISSGFCFKVLLV